MSILIDKNQVARADNVPLQPTPCIIPLSRPTNNINDAIKVFSPTDAQLNSLKNNFKFVLKLTLN